jgi:hypothetical protein
MELAAAAALRSCNSSGKLVASCFSDIAQPHPESEKSAASRA